MFRIRQQARRETGSERWGLSVHLLREHVAAERNTPVKGYCGKVSTLAALHLGPRYQSRDDARHGGAHEVQEAEVSIDGAYMTAFLWALRAKVQQLDDPREVVARSGVRNARDVANLGGKRLFNGRGDQRAAVRDEELQQCRGGEKEYECRH